MQWFVWLKTPKCGYEPQLWLEDYTTGPSPYYREDCHREIAERVVQKIKLAPGEENITLARAIEKYPHSTGLL